MVYLLMTVSYTIGQRAIIVANYTYLMNLHGQKYLVFRLIFFSIILSDILMTPAGFLSLQSNQIHLSFLFRQISSSTICLITILFYLIWFWTRTFSTMSCQVISLLILSNLNCLIITLFLLVMSIPKYYLLFTHNEQWFYYFQILPMLIIFFLWFTFHPEQNFLETTNSSQIF